MVDGTLAVAEEGDDRPAAVRDVDAVDVAVIVDDRLHGGLPEDGRVVAAAAADGAAAELGGALAAAAGPHSEEVGVLELHEKASALAEIPPNGVPDDVETGGAAGFEGLRAGFQLEDEAFLPVDDLLADADGVEEQVRRRSRVQALGVASHNRENLGHGM